MPRKEGQIIKYFTLSDGSRHSVAGKTEREVLEKLAIARIKMEEHIKLNTVDRDTTLGEWGIICLNSKTCSESRKKNYYQIADKHIFPYLGQMKLKDIRQIDCEICIKNMKGYSDYYITQAVQLLNLFFEKAIKNHMLISNPADGMERPRGHKEKRRALTEEERNTFLAVRDNPRFLCFDIMYDTGMRPSEVRELKGYDVVMTKSGPGLHVRGTKTRNADRIVPLPDRLYEKVKSTPPNDFICKSERLSKMDEKAFQRAFNSLRRAMNIEMGCKSYRNELLPPFPLAEDFVPYNFRHDYCTRLCYKGLPPTVIMRVMGHSNTQLINEVYSHINDEMVYEKFKELESM